MSLPITPPFAPMEALAVEGVPSGSQWQYEPKWDGFRCLVFRDGSEVQLQSKSGQPLARYFPELLEIFRHLKAPRFVLDGEIVIPVSGHFSFDDLLLRIHPAESRVRKLAAEHPATFIGFDLLVDPAGKSLVEKTLSERRGMLEAFAGKYMRAYPTLRLSPATRDRSEAETWLSQAGGNLDGIVAKRLDLEYRSGLRDGMQKIKRLRTADCVVGGFRYATRGRVIGSLLLGLYEKNLLHHVGFCSGLTEAEKKRLTPILEQLVQPPGFTGRAPGGPSRWSNKRSTKWQPLKPDLVVEVGYDHFTGGRFRHGTRLIRWRPDKAPAQCRMDQVSRPAQEISLLAA